jgi:hypothetical protein
MPENQPFEILQELRHLGEENVERARQLYDQFMVGVTQAMAAWPAPPSSMMAPEFEEARERAAKFAKENADAAFELAKQVSQAKDLQELVDLQTRYVQSQMRWYGEQTQEFGKLMIKALGAMKEAQNLKGNAQPAKDG